LADEKGTLLLDMRNYGRSNLRAQARSMDGGQTWTSVERHPQLIEPKCQASIIRCNWPESAQPGRILFSNPAATTRTNMTLRVSRDDTITWPVSKVLYPGPSAYSCLTALPGGDIACLYECGQTNPYQKIIFARFPISWVEGE
jgi:sialidase-1